MEKLYCKICEAVTEHTEILDCLYVCSECGQEQDPRGKVQETASEDDKAPLKKKNKGDVMAKQRRLSEEQKKQIISDMENRAVNGLTVKNIAEKHGIAKSLVLYHYNRRNKKLKVKKKGKMKAEKFNKKTSVLLGSSLMESAAEKQRSFNQLKNHHIGPVVLKNKLRETIREIVREEIEKLF